MKFEKRYFYSQVPEWKQRYIDYNGLVAQIRLIKKSALILAKAYGSIKAITGDEVGIDIKVDQIGADRVFWRMLDENVDKVEQFYTQQLTTFTERFHLLTLQAIRLGVIKEYVPLTRGLTTRLERELERLSLAADFGVATAIAKEDVMAPIVNDGTKLMRLTSKTKYKDVVEQIKQPKKEGTASDRFAGELADEEASVALATKLQKEEKLKTHSASPEAYTEDFDFSDVENEPHYHHGDTPPDYPEIIIDTESTFGHPPPAGIPGATMKGAAFFPPTSSTPIVGGPSVSPAPPIQTRAGPPPGDAMGDKGKSKSQTSVFSEDDASDDGWDYDSDKSEEMVGDGTHAPTSSGDFDVESGQSVDLSASVSLSNGTSTFAGMKNSKTVWPNKARRQSQGFPQAADGRGAPIPAPAPVAPNPLSASAQIAHTNPITGSPHLAQRYPLTGSAAMLSREGSFDSIGGQPKRKSILNLRALSERDLPTELHAHDESVHGMARAFAKSPSSPSPTLPPNAPPRPVDTGAGVPLGGDDDDDDDDDEDVVPLDSIAPPTPAKKTTPKMQYDESHNNVIGEEADETERLERLGVKDKGGAVSQLKAAFAEFYRGLALLQQYAKLNVEAIEKLLKKHDKNIEMGTRERYMGNIIVNYSFFRRGALKALLRETEHVFATCFTEGHRTAAMHSLRVPTEKKKVVTATFRFGFFLGLSLAILTFCLYLVSVVDGDLLARLRPGLIAYRMLGMAVLMTWYWGFDMYIWTKYRVNYVFIFEFNTRSHVTYHQIFDAASTFTFVLSLNMLLYMLIGIQTGLDGWYIPSLSWLAAIPAHTVPMAFFAIILIMFVLYQIKSRWWIVRTIGRIWGAPFLPVVFRDFFLADQLISLVIVMQDLEYTICYFSTDAWTGESFCRTSHTWILPVIAAFPAVSRLLQCFRRFHDNHDFNQLLNAGKYSTGLIVISLNACCKADPDGFGKRIVFLIAATLYTYSWDLLKDWSLVDRSPQLKHRYLRSKLLYPVAWYYTAMVLNLGLRFMWTLTISPESALTGVIPPDIFTTMLAAIEITRRAMWNLFRLENEHLNNCDNFRALQDIPLPISIKEMDD